MSSDQLPSDLADAHVMIVALRSETLVRRLETEKLKFIIAKLRREQFGQSSERGKLLVEQLELAIADVEESQGEAEAEADIAAPVAALTAHEHRPRRPPRPVLSIRRPAPAPNVGGHGCVSSMRSCRVRSNASRGVGRSSNTCARR